MEEIINDLILVGARVSMSFYECKSDFELLEILKILDKCNYNYNNIDCLVLHQFIMLLVKL